MFTISRLFNYSPFSLLQSHRTVVAKCVHHLPELMEALKNGDEKKLLEISEKICALEHDADVIKNEIRHHLPKNLVLPISRESLLDLLTIQDKIADKAQDAAVLVTLKPLKLLPSLEEPFMSFFHKNIQAFDEAKGAMEELHELVESSFGGIEAVKVQAMVVEAAKREHEVDLLQRELVKKLFAEETKLTYTSFYQWHRLIEHIADISNLSENLAYRLLMTLEV